MDRKSKRVLNYLCSEKGYKEIFYGVANTLNDISEMSIRLNISVRECKAAVDYLEVRGFVKFTRDSVGNIMSFRLTHIGMNYKAFWRIELRDFLMKSVVVPIVVAIITAILTTGTLWLLGWK